MKRRISNRRSSIRKSINATDILTENTNIIENDDALWFDRTIIRPSTSIILPKYASPVLNPNSSADTTPRTEKLFDYLSQSDNSNLMLESLKKKNKSILYDENNVSDAPQNTESESDQEFLRKRSKFLLTKKKQNETENTNVFSVALEKTTISQTKNVMHVQDDVGSESEATNDETKSTEKLRPLVFKSKNIVTNKSNNFDEIFRSSESENNDTIHKGLSKRNSNIEKNSLKNKSVENLRNSNSVNKKINKNISKNQTTDISKNQTTDISKNQTTDISKNQATNISKNQATDISKNQAKDISQNQATDISQNQTTDISKKQKTNVSKNQKTNVSKNQATDISKNQTIDVSKNQTTDISKNQITDVSKNKTTNISKNQTIDVSKKNSGRIIANSTESNVSLTSLKSFENISENKRETWSTTKKRSTLLLRGHKNNATTNLFDAVLQEHSQLDKTNEHLDSEFNNSENSSLPKNIRRTIGKSNLISNKDKDNNESMHEKTNIRTMNDSSSQQSEISKAQGSKIQTIIDSINESRSSKRKVGEYTAISESNSKNKKAMSELNISQRTLTRNSMITDDGLGDDLLQTPNVAQSTLNPSGKPFTRLTEFRGFETDENSDRDSRLPVNTAKSVPSKSKENKSLSLKENENRHESKSLPRPFESGQNSDISEDNISVQNEQPLQHSKNVSKANFSTQSKKVSNISTIQESTLSSAIKKVDLFKSQKLAAFERDEAKKQIIKQKKEQSELKLKRTMALKQAKMRSKRKTTIDKAYLVNGKLYKQPKLLRPNTWATDKLYKYIWGCMEKEFGLRTRIESEKFIQKLSKMYNFIIKKKKFQEYSSDLDNLLVTMAKLNIIKTRMNFYVFCSNFMPYNFKIKVVPMMLPGNKRNIPFDPELIFKPILQNQNSSDDNKS